ncbi:MAG: hypothetical protein JST00_05520 [Deltaproteobacteria bacterium]|nr:hypothetical protein [Deltaproteobacteria bacterium]
MRILLCLTSAILLASCAGETVEPDASGERVGETVLTISSPSSIRRLVGNEHGVLAIEPSGAWTVIRPGGARVRADVGVACPWKPAADALPVESEAILLESRVVFVSSACGVWSYAHDGSDLVEVVKRTDDDTGKPVVTWGGGGGPAFQHFLTAAVHRDRLFVCLGPALGVASASPPRVQIWSSALDGAAPRAKLATLDIVDCPRFVADDDALYFTGNRIVRLDRATLAVSELARAPDRTNHGGMTLTSQYVVWLADHYERRDVEIQRVAKRGGNVERVAGNTLLKELVSDGSRVLGAGERTDIVEVAGDSVRTLFDAKATFPTFALSNGALYWVRDGGVTARDTELARVPLR